MAPKCSALFKNEHASLFGIRTGVRDALTKKVTLVSCHFFIHFGRDEMVGSNRNRAINVKYFKRPFRVDIYGWNLLFQHSMRLKEYSDLNGARKQDSSMGMPQWLNATPPNLTFVVCKFLFICLWKKISSMLSLARCFSRIMMPIIRLRRSVLSVISKTFLMLRKLMMLSMSPHQDVVFVWINLPNFSQLMTLSACERHFKWFCESWRWRGRVLAWNRLGLCLIGRRPPSLDSYVRSIFNRWRTCWLAFSTFSVVMDMSTHMATSCLDISIRLYWNGHILVFHLLAILMFSHYTCEQISLHAAKTLDVLAFRWKEMVVSISTDGERKMTGCIQGVAACFEQAALSGFFRIWCDLYQIEIKFQRFFMFVMGNSSIPVSRRWSRISAGSSTLAWIWTPRLQLFQTLARSLWARHVADSSQIVSKWWRISTWRCLQWHQVNSYGLWSCSFSRSRLKRELSFAYFKDFQR